MAAAIPPTDPPTDIASPRIVSLDFLRGIGVMGILLMNIVGFGLPEMAYYSPDIVPGADHADRIAWLLSFIFVDGKFRGLFTLLFGASMLLIAEQAERKGHDPVTTHYSRLVWLAVFGLLHMFLLWNGDILFLYACYGAIAFALRDWDAETLIRRALLLYACGFVLFSLMWGELLLGAGVAPADVGADIVSISDEIALYRSSYHSIFTERLLTDWQHPLELVAWSAFETLPLIMLGMALYRIGLLGGEWSGERTLRMGLRLTGTGLAVTAALGALAIFHDFELVWMFNILSAWILPATLMLTVGYACLLVEVVRRWPNSPITRRIAAAGRTAFSNYLGTSLILCPVFYGWGLGWFAHIGRAELYWLVLPVWALMLTWPVLWLRHFRFGPFEWLWRSLARGRWQKMRMQS